MKRLLEFFTRSYAGILCTLIILLLSSPFLETSPLGLAITHILFSIAIVLCVLLVQGNKKIFLLFFVLGIAPFLLRWARYLEIASPALLSVSLLLDALFLFSICIYIIRHFFKATEVSADVLFSAVTVYLLIGLFFGIVYSLIGATNPEAFRLPELINLHSSSPGALSTYLYYSFVTLTTLGFGEITPATQFVQTVTILEAIIGQMFLAILVGRLVGLSLVSQQKAS